MLKDLTDLLQTKSIGEGDNQNKKNSSKASKLSRDEIDQILINAWEVCISNTELAQEKTLKGLEASYGSNYSKGISLALRNQAYLSMLQSDYKKGIENSKASLSQLNKEEIEIAGTIWDIVALCYNGLGLYEQSVQTTYKSLDLFQKAEYTRGIAWSHHNLAMVFSNIGDLDKAEIEYKKALNIFEQINHKEGLSRICTLLSKLFQKLGDFSQAMDFLDRAETFINKNEITVQSFSMFLNKGICFRLLKDLNSSESSFVTSHQIIEKLANVELEAQYEYEIALLYMDKGELLKSGLHLKKAYKLASQFEGKLLKKEISHAMSRIKEKLGEYKESLQFYKKYDQISKELMNNDSLQRIHNMELHKEIELAEKEKDYHRKLQEETEKILKNVLPIPIVEELKKSGHVKPKRIISATALFTDFVGFTKISSHTSPEEIVSQLDYCFSGFDKIVEELGIEKLKTIGDGYMAVAGALSEVDNHSELCVIAGLRIQKFMEEYIQKRKNEKKEFWDVRIGIHCGPLIAGIIGSNKFSYDVWGDTVNTASRIESGGEIGKVNISLQVYELVKNRFKCQSIGEIKAKGKGMIPIYTVENEL